MTTKTTATPGRKNISYFILRNFILIDLILSYSDINYINNNNDAKHNIKADNHSASDYDDNTNAW